MKMLLIEVVKDKNQLLVSLDVETVLFVVNSYISLPLSIATSANH